MYLSKLLATGTQNYPFSVASKVKTTNLVTFFTFVVSALYTLNYVFILNHPIVAVINLLFTFSYLIPLALNRFESHRTAKTIFFIILMLHLVICTNLYVTRDSGFHLYFFLVPTGAFLLFETKDKYHKVVLSLIATLLFFYCENTVNENPLIALSDTMNHYIYQSVVFINMIEVVFVLTLFVNQIETNEEKLFQQAKTDALTKIANRHFFFEQGNKQLEQATDNERPYTVALIDIDHFKSINDKYGHNAGDVCLMETARMFKMLVRKQDVIARIGGEEFVIAMPETTMKEAQSIVERIREAVSEHSIEIDVNTKFSCTASFGIATLSEECRDLKSLLNNADKALYQAKESGRNRVFTFA